MLNITTTGVDGQIKHVGLNRDQFPLATGRYALVGGATRCGGRCLRGLLGLRLRVFILLPGLPDHERHEQQSDD
ncbi:Uncharacterised protein [Shigella flexneri]|nr:Uncharacterised protein [Shigella flexneri]